MLVKKRKPYPNLFAYGRQTLLMSILDDGSKQALIGGHCDAHIYLVISKNERGETIR